MQLSRLLKVAGRNMRLKPRDWLPKRLQVCLEIAYNDETVEAVKQPTLIDAYETLQAAFRAQGADIVSLLWARRICVCELLPPGDALLGEKEPQG